MRQKFYLIMVLFVRKTNAPHVSVIAVISIIIGVIMIVSMVRMLTLEYGSEKAREFNYDI